MVSTNQQDSANRETGEVLWYKEEGGFGCIKRSNGSDAWFHISNVSDQSKAPMKKGDKVSFTAVTSKKVKDGVDATDIVREWSYGVIVTVKHDRGFGFIRFSHKEESIHFKLRDVNNCEPHNIRKGQYVAYSDLQKNNTKLNATNILITEKCFGEVVSWDNGKGKIRPANSDNDISVHWSEIVLDQKDGFRSLETGDTVTFLIVEGKKASLVRSEYELRCFADLGDEEMMLEALADKALEEDWSYSNKSSKSSYDILWNYIFYTFQRLKDEDKDSTPESAKIKISDSGDVAVFNTGLVDRQYRVLYAFFRSTAPAQVGKPRWSLVGFSARGERLNGVNYPTYFKDLPERAVYFDDQSELLYDHTLRLDAVTDHIIGDRGYRLPKRIRETVSPNITDSDEIISELNRHLEMAIKRALERIKWNYKAAIPQYYPTTKKIQLLLPLCIDDPRIVDVAIAVQRENQAYVGYTILELDWAYNNARLIARPDSDWLSPQKIVAEEADED